MRYLILILVLVFSINLFAEEKKVEAEGPQEIILHRNCRKAENKPCIAMDFSTLDKKLIISKNSVGNETEFTLKLFGKLNRETEKEHVVKFVGSGEKGCTSFGKGTVGVLGFSNSGNPILLTEEGSLEITSKLVTVGANNVQIVNLTNLHRDGFLSKSFDMTPAAISRIHFDSNGHLYFIDGTECFETRRNETFRKVDIKRCESKKLEIKDLTKIEKIRLKPSQTAYEIKDSPYIMILDTATCS